MMTTRAAEIFDIRNPKTREWATICIDEKTGSFMANSSFGRFAYNWRSIGECTLKEFLLDLEFDYFMGKAFGIAHMEFDADRSIEGIKGEIIERRRTGDINKKAAREVYDAVDHVATHSEQAFYESVYNCPILWKFYDGDIGGLSRQRRNPQCVGFWQDIWPLFLEEIKAPAKAEQASA